MRRLNFFSGLTIILLLLMTLGGFCIWISQALTDDIRTLIARNFDRTIMVRELRNACTRINAACLVATDHTDLQAEENLYRAERDIMRKAIKSLGSTITDPAETQLVSRLQAMVEDYLHGIDGLFAMSNEDAEAFRRAQLDLANKTASMAEVAGGIVKMNEDAIFARRDAAIARGLRAKFLALGLVALSLVLYIYTSLRLTQGVFQPLSRLRDSIMQVREKKFANFVPVEGSDELGQIASTFNQMATEMRAYILEKDERVIAANRRNRAIVAALPKPVYIVDNNLDVLLMNPRAERLSGGLGVPDRVPSIVRHAIDAAASQNIDLVGDDLRRAIEVEWVHPELGKTRSAFIPQVFRMRSDNGDPEGWAVLLMDVTNLRQIDAAKSKAISTLGHEVKTPVTGIRMTLLLLLEEKLGPLNPDQRELLESGRDDCERLLSVLQSLLELARLESGRAALHPTPTEASVLVAQAEMMHGGYVKKSGRELVVSLPDEPVPVVMADVFHAERVLGNFMSNAVKYGRAELPILLRVSPRGDGYVRFSVVNESERPLTEVEQAHVFEPFYRRGGEIVEGSGLGLTICREIASLHGGRIGVWSSDKSVEFYFDLRAAVAPAAVPALTTTA